MGHTRFATPLSGPHVADKRHLCDRQLTHMWQSTGTEMAIKRHMYGSEQTHNWPMCGNCPGPHMAINRYVDGSQQTHTWQSKGTYMAVNGYIRSSHTHMVHTWQLFVHTKGTELVIKRSRNW